MIRTDTAVRGFVVTLVTGILAVTFLPMGIAFAIIGAVSEPEAFFLLGLIFAFVGLDLAAFAISGERGPSAATQRSPRRVPRGPPRRCSRPSPTRTRASGR